MNRAALPLLTLALTLTGCAGTPQPTETVYVTETAAAEPSATPSASPVEVTPTPVGSEPSGPEAMSDDEIAEAANIILKDQGITVTGEEIGSALLYACEQLEAGVAPESITALEGAPAEVNLTVVDFAIQSRCPEQMY